jgi:3'(2'), 5'-bisphosphate nucleotidase
LVEDGRPIYGVVYAPESDTLYYARSGKGSFKVERGGLPQKLEPGGHPSHESASRAQAPPGSSTSGTGIGLSGENTEARGACDALAMCAVAEGKTPIYRCAVPTDEWEIAAAHAIANGAGKGVYECSSSEELKYNKDDMVTKCFTVR